MAEPKRVLSHAAHLEAAKGRSHGAVWVHSSFWSTTATSLPVSVSRSTHWRNRVASPLIVLAVLRQRLPDGRPPPGCAEGWGGPADQQPRLGENQRQVVVQAAPRMGLQPANQPVERGTQR
jgi:hypothetical protein